MVNTDNRPIDGGKAVPVKEAGKILKNAGPYSVLLVGIVITTFFQVYSKEKELQKEDKIKIGEVGYYTLAFKRQEDVYEEVYLVSMSNNVKFEKHCFSNTYRNTLYPLRLQICDLNSCNGAKTNISQVIL